MTKQTKVAAPQIVRFQEYNLKFSFDLFPIIG